MDIVMCIYSFNEKGISVDKSQLDTRHLKHLNKDQICRDCSINVTTFKSRHTSRNKGKLGE